MKTQTLLSALVLLMALPFVGPSALAEDEKPTIAVLRFGPHYAYSQIDNGLMGAMLATGMISEEQRNMLGQTMEGERVNIIWGDANFDFANANLIVEQALDAGADVLITYSSPVTLSAVSITEDMDDPPAVLFAAVYDPVAAGIVQSICIKPDHVTGVESVTRYEDIVPLLLLQNPDIQLIGTLYNLSETSGVAGAAEIIAAAEAQGIAVMEKTITSVSDIAIAAESLVDAGIEALLIPADMSTVNALPILMQIATENQLPVFHSVALAIAEGATVSAGTTKGALQGRVLAALAKGYLEGSLDLATTGVGLVSNLVVSVNLDMAELQNIAISDDLLAAADRTVQDGAISNAASIARRLEAEGLDDEEIELVLAFKQSQEVLGETELKLPARLEAVAKKVLMSGGLQAEFENLMASLHCTDEMIAEQQAALDAAGG